MNVLIVTSSPNKDGLTAAAGLAAKTGAEQAGAKVTSVCLNDYQIFRCEVCGNGWGTCRNEHVCRMTDDFQGIRHIFGEADAYVLVTPVYWGEMSESAKAFFDRLRRNEAFRGEKSCAYNKPFIAVAAAGGSGSGTITCLASMERLVAHLKGRRFDLIGITRFNREAMLLAIQSSVAGMVENQQHA